ncbi:DUF791-domain-containing protein [Lentinus brumalis]|uniref:Molybdate-anion transporter n=1 Tax=Lentinus brumalis TaxID=2498619 RepID=A0A371DGR2_9APHY|nr:DUF791-domain-containing protein [Polyporus brumalis]
MTFYQWQLVGLVAACVVFLTIERYVLRKTNIEDHTAENSAPLPIVSRLAGRYLSVYAIVMGADWLQGPYIYSLYREQYGLPERLVAFLFVLGFLTAGLAAPFVGVWADQFGRKRLCMVFCLIYTLACVFIQLPSLPLLFVGRLLGGVGTAILFSSFESWLVTSANNLTLSSRDLSRILGRATLINSVAAAVAGVASNKLVEQTDSFSAPFIASGILLLLGWAVIALLWSENYGAAGSSASELIDWARLAEAWRIVRADKRLLVLGLTQTCFEGAMYLFVFLWVPFLQEATPQTPGSLPLGYIFSSFMVSMTLGSVIYTSIVSLSRLDGSAPHAQTSDSSTSESASSDTPHSALPSHERAITLHAKLSSAVCVVSAAAFLLSIANEHEHPRFWAFCVFEACVGVYYPVQGMLRGRLIEDEHRATLSSLFRVPLNVFVFVALLTGVSSARRVVLTGCAGLLLFSALVTAAVFLRRRRGPALASLRTR